MIVVIMLLVSLMMTVVLSARVIGFDRRIDASAQPAPEPPAPDSPSALPPETAAAAARHEEMVHRALVPVQYVDNGLLPMIVERSDQVEGALPARSGEHWGPEPYDAPAQLTLHASPPRFAPGLPALPPLDVPDLGETTGMPVEPYNSLLGMIVSEGQTVGEVGDSLAVADTTTL